MKIPPFICACTLVFALFQTAGKAATDYTLHLDASYNWDGAATPWVPDGPPEDGDNLTLYRDDTGNGYLNLRGDRTLGLLKATKRQVNISTGSIGASYPASTLTLSRIEVTSGQLGFANGASDTETAPRGALSVSVGTVEITSTMRLGTAARPVYSFIVNEGTTINSGAVLDISAIGINSEMKFGALVNSGTFRLAYNNSTTFTEARPYTAEVSSLSSANTGAKITTDSLHADAVARPTLSIQSTNVTPVTYAGTIEDGSSNAMISVKKGGSGIQIFSNANGYSGGTIISGGLLAVNNTSGSGLGIGAVVVESGGRLGGAGILATGTTITVQAGGSLAPGNIGTEALGVLRIDGNTTVTMQKDASFDIRFGQSNISDRINFINYNAGNLLLAADGIAINGSQAQDGSFTLFTFHGITNSELGDLAGLFRLGSGFDGYVGTFSFAGGGGNAGEIVLTLEAIPEPRSLIPLGMAALLGAVHWNRRRQYLATKE